MMILFHVTPMEKVDSILTNGLIPQIGERSKKISEEKGIFLFPSEEDMEQAMLSWLADEFDEDEELASLKIMLPDDFPLESPVEYERVSRVTIESKYIEFYKEL